MINLKSLLTVIVLSAIGVASLAQAPAEPVSLQKFNAFDNDLVTGGQPSEDELLQLKHAGVTKVINLRGENEEISFVEKEAVEKLGLTYVSLPVQDASDITLENSQKLHEELKGGEKVFLHCASGNRVGALLAIRAHNIEGKSVNESLELGRAAGLSSLENVVKATLDKHGNEPE